MKNKRLIDANITVTSLKFAAEMVEQTRGGSFFVDGYKNGVLGAADAITEIPTVDAVEIVRCRACPHYHAYVNAKQGRGLCDHFMHEMPEDGYCSEHRKGDKDA